jgi:hypothetical protein
MYFTSFLPVISPGFSVKEQKKSLPCNLPGKDFLQTQYWEACLSTESLHLGRILSLYQEAPAFSGEGVPLLAECPLENVFTCFRTRQVYYKNVNLWMARN